MPRIRRWIDLMRGKNDNDDDDDDEDCREKKPNTKRVKRDDETPDDPPLTALS